MGKIISAQNSYINGDLPVSSNVIFVKPNSFFNAETICSLSFSVNSVGSDAQSLKWKVSDLLTRIKRIVSSEPLYFEYNPD